MIREKQEREMVIDLTGPDGNAFVLMVTAQKLAKQLGLDPEEVLTEMQAGDYENLIEVFDRYFGDFAILER